MGEVERAQRLVLEIDLAEGELDPVSDAIGRAVERATARLELHAAIDRRIFRGSVVAWPRLSDAVRAALAAPGAVTIEVEAEGLPPGWLEAALREG